MVAMRDRIAGPDTRDMRDDADVRFTAHELAREDLQALMLRADGPALRRAVWHLGMLIVTGAVLWRLASTMWAVPLIGEARTYLALYLTVAAASIAFRSPIALVVWIVPWMLGQAFLRPYLLAEHTGCAFTRDCLENTRTTLTWPLVKLFAWNMPYHAEHHAFPAIPFHALPRLHARVRGKIDNLEPGYVRASVKVARYLFGTRD